MHHVARGQVDAVAGDLLGDVGGDRLVALGGGRVVDVAKALRGGDRRARDGGPDDPVGRRR